MRIWIYRVTLAVCALALIGSFWLPADQADIVRVMALGVAGVLLSLLQDRAGVDDTFQQLPD